MSLIVFLGGVPGSGKSTYAKKFLFPKVSADDNRLRLTGDVSNFSREREVWDLVHQQVAYYIRTGKPFVYDATNAHGPLRRKMLNYMRSLGDVYLYGIFLDVSLARARRQNGQRIRQVPDSVLERMHRQFFADPPTIEEGYDTLCFTRFRVNRRDEELPY